MHTLLYLLWGALWGIVGYQIIRIAIKESCPKCGSDITYSHLFLLLSCGKCKGKRKINSIFLASILLSCTLSLLCSIDTKSTYEYLLNFFPLWSLCVAAISDAKYLMIPNVTLLISLVTSIIKVAVLKETIPQPVLGALFGAGILTFIKVLYKITKKSNGIATADILFMIPIGLYFGLSKSFILLMLASFLGGIVGILLLIATKKREIPFLPFVFISAVIVYIL